MKETLQFERSTPNPAGIEWVVGSGAEVGSDLYMVVQEARHVLGLSNIDPVRVFA